MDFVTYIFRTLYTNYYILLYLYNYLYLNNKITNNYSKIINCSLYVFN